MDKFSELSDDLLVKILSFVPTKVAVSTSILSKRWEFLWMWVPKIDLEYCDFCDINDSYRSKSSRMRYRYFINKKIPLHRAPIIETLRLIYRLRSFQADDIKLLVGIAVFRCVRELSITYSSISVNDEPDLVLPSNLYTCESLVTLILHGDHILVDVPPMVCLPSLKTMQLGGVTYSDEDSLGLLLSCCPVLEDLFIERHSDDDSVNALVVNVPSLQRLSLTLWMNRSRSSNEYVIVTPSLKYFKLQDSRESFSFLIEHMPKLEEANIGVHKDLDLFLESITSVKRLSISGFFNNEEQSMYRAGIVFHQLEQLKLTIFEDNWSKLLVRLLSDSPKLRVLDLYVYEYFFSDGYERINWSIEKSSVPTCLLKSLETFEFKGYQGRPEERDFLSFIFKNACCLKSTSILRSGLER